MPGPSILGEDAVPAPDVGGHGSFGCNLMGHDTHSDAPAAQNL